MKRISSVVLTMSVFVIAMLLVACDDKPVVGPKLNSPDFTPNRNKDFETSQVVTITAETNAPEGAKIHYTLDGTVPSETVGESTLLYNSIDEITLDTTATIKAIVIADGRATSDVATSPVFTKIFVWGGEDDVKEPTLVGNVYELYLPSELAWIAEQTTNNFSGKTIKLMNSFNMNEQQFNGIKTFSGTFDGNNQRLKAVTILHPAENIVGFIWVLNDVGTIKNLTIETGTITGAATTGGFVGQSTGTTTLEGLVNGADVTGGNKVGGIVGHTTNTSQIKILNTENNGTIANNSSAGSYTGGIIGYDESSTTTIENAENWGYIQTTENAGGIVGYGATKVKNAENNGTIIASSYAGGIFGKAMVGASVENVKNVNSIKGTQAGGIAGLWSGGTVIKAENSSKITGTGDGDTYVGGIIASADVPITIINSGNTGELISEGKTGSYTGGIIGFSTAKIEINNSYNYGSLTATVKGGMVGLIPVSGSCTIDASYYLDTTANDVVGEGTATGGSSLTADQFTDQDSFIGWDFETIWEIIVKDPKYPTLQ